MIIVLIWRRKMNKYAKKVDKENEVVFIFLEPVTDDSEDFISIWVDDDGTDINSPFKNIEDAEIFADVIIKLLETAPLLGD